MASILQPDAAWVRTARSARLSLVLTAAALVGTGLYLGWKDDWFTPSESFYFQAKSSKSLSKGIAVRLSGFKIGQVTRVDLQEDRSVRVEFQVFKRYLYLVKTDCVVHVQAGIPIGDAFVEVMGGSGRADAPEPGARLKFIEDPQPMDQIVQFLGRLDPLVDNLNGLFKQAAETQAELQVSLRNLSDTTNRIQAWTPGFLERSDADPRLLRQGGRRGDRVPLTPERPEWPAPVGPPGAQRGDGGIPRRASADPLRRERAHLEPEGERPGPGDRGRPRGSATAPAGRVDKEDRRRREPGRRCREGHRSHPEPDRPGAPRARAPHHSMRVPRDPARRERLPWISPALAAAAWICSSGCSSAPREAAAPYQEAAAAEAKSAQEAYGEGRIDGAILSLRESVRLRLAGGDLPGAARSELNLALAERASGDAAAAGLEAARPARPDPGRRPAGPRGGRIRRRSARGRARGFHVVAGCAPCPRSRRRRLRPGPGP